MRAISLTGSSMVQEGSITKMEECMKDSGFMGKCKAMGNFIIKAKN
jgi:hypothetical protein